MSTVVNPDTNEHEAATPERGQEAAPPATLSCRNCGAPADRGQLMCLECGSRLALGYQRPPAWRLPAAIVGVVLLIARFAVALALAAHHAGKTTPPAPTQTPPPPSAPADTPPTPPQPTPAP